MNSFTNKTLENLELSFNWPEKYFRAFSGGEEEEIVVLSNFY